MTVDLSMAIIPYKVSNAINNLNIFTTNSVGEMHIIHQRVMILSM